MSKSLIQTANPSSQTVAVNGIINPGSVIRRFGCNCRLSGNGIEVEGEGYYKIDASITLAPTAAGNATVVMYKDGSPVTGARATESVTTAGNSVSLPIIATIRKGCNCDGASNITFVLTEGASTVTNIAVRIEKA